MMRAWEKVLLHFPGDVKAVRKTSQRRYHQDFIPVTIQESTGGNLEQKKRGDAEGKSL